MNNYNNIQTQIEELHTKIVYLQDYIKKSSTGSSPSQGIDNQEIEKIKNDIERIDEELKVQVNKNELNETKIESYSNFLNNFFTIIRDRNRAINVPFEELDFSNIYQTYDVFERKYETYGSSTAVSSPIYFRCDSGNIKYKVKVRGNATANTSGSVMVKVDNEIVYSLPISISTETSEYSFEFSSTIQNTAHYATVHFSGTKINLYYVKLEIFANNIFILNKPNVHNVYYYNNYYYLSDCSGQTAKYCIIHKDNLTTTDDIVWVDSGIPAIEMVFSANSTYTQSVEIPDVVSFAFLKLNNKMIIKNNLLNGENLPTNTSIYHISATLPDSSYSVKLLLLNYSDSLAENDCLTKTFSKTIINTGGNTALSSLVEPFASIECGASLVNSYIKNNYYPSVITRPDGHLAMHYYQAVIELPFGINPTLYMLNKEKNQYALFSKVGNQIVKYEISFAPGKLTLLNTSVVGYYDKYFMGANNDYFILKDNKIHYYKNDAQN